MGNGGSSAHPCAEPASRAERTETALERGRREWVVWPYRANAKDADGPPVPKRPGVDNTFAVGVFASPTPDSARVGELYKGQTVVGVAELTRSVGRGPLGLCLGCSEEDTWLRLSNEDTALAWDESTLETELWVHMEHRHAGCDGHQIQVYLVEALLRPTPEPEPEQLATADAAADGAAQPALARRITPPRLSAAGVSPEEVEALTHGHVDRSSMDVLRLSTSSMDVMRMSNSSQCSFEDDHEAQIQAADAAAAVAQQKDVQKRKQMGKRQKEIEKEVEKELRTQGLQESGETDGLRRELRARGEPTDGDVKELRARLKKAIVAARLAESWMNVVSSSDAETAQP